MSEKKTFSKITDTELKAKGVVSLADRPNVASSYGVGGLSATNLKLWFDKLGKFLAEKINEIYSVLNGEGADEGVYGSDYISIPPLSDDITCLTDLVKAISSGDLVNLLMAYASASETELTDVQSIINGFAKQIAELEETVGLIYYGAHSTSETLKVGYSASTTMTDLSMNEAVKAGYYFLLFWTDTSTNIDYLCACLATAVTDSTVTWQVVSYVRLTGATGERGATGVSCVVFNSYSSSATPEAGNSIALTLSYFNSTPVVDDVAVGIVSYYDGETVNYYFVTGQITNLTDETATVLMNNVVVVQYTEGATINNTTNEYNLKSVSANASTLEAGSKATAEANLADGIAEFSFGIPQGEKGDTGGAGADGADGENAYIFTYSTSSAPSSISYVDVSSLTWQNSTPTDAESGITVSGFWTDTSTGDVYFVTAIIDCITETSIYGTTTVTSVCIHPSYDTSTITKLNGSDGNDGQDGNDGATGADGADGVGIADISLTSTVDLVDTYTITLTDGTTYNFTVTNGSDSSTTATATVETDDDGDSVLVLGGIMATTTTDDDGDTVLVLGGG